MPYVTISDLVFLTSYDALLQEKKELEEEFERLQQEVKPVREGSQSKEMSVLKKVIKNLEVCITNRCNDETMLPMATGRHVKG